MNNIKTVLFIAILILLTSCSNYVFAGEKEKSNYPDRDVRKEYKAFKDHHLKDIHSFKLFKYKKEDKTVYVSFPLPIIIYCEGELDVFMSSKFYNDKKIKIPKQADFTFKEKADLKLTVMGKAIFDAIMKRKAKYQIDGTYYIDTKFGTFPLKAKLAEKEM